MFVRFFKSKIEENKSLASKFIGDRSYEEIIEFWDHFHKLSEEKKNEFIKKNNEIFLEYKNCKFEMLLLVDSPFAFKYDSMDYFKKLNEQDKKQFELTYPELFKLLQSDLSPINWKDGLVPLLGEPAVNIDNLEETLFDLSIKDGGLRQRRK